MRKQLIRTRTITNLCLFLLVMSFFTWTSCDIINPEEPTPAFIHVDSFQFVHTDSTYTSSQKITSVWAYFNNVSVGVFDLPATIPVVAEAPGTLSLIPGVTFSGLKSYQTQYPFFLSDSVNIAPGVKRTVTPHTSYYDYSLLYLWAADFELENRFTKVEGDTSITRVTDPALVFEGVGSGYIYLHKPQSISVSISKGTFVASPDAYLELNYKCSIAFQVGLFTVDKNGNNVLSYVIGLNPRDTWNKVYIGLKDITGTYPDRPYSLLVRAELGDNDEGFVALDNFKVVSLK